MKFGKYISILSVMALGLFGCIRDEEIKDGPGTVGEGLELTLKVALPESTAATRAGDQALENDIESLDFIIFRTRTSTPSGAEINYYRRIDLSAVSGTDDFRTFTVSGIPTLTKLVNDEELNIVLIANSSGVAQDLVADYMTTHTVNRYLNELYNALIAEMPDDATSIPMWGLSDPFKVTVNGGVQEVDTPIPTIQMIRAYSRFDVTQDPALDATLEIKSVELLNSYKEFRFAPTNAVLVHADPRNIIYNYDFTTRKVTKITRDGLGSELRETEPVDVPADGEATLYLTEHDNSVATNELALIVKADYGTSGNREEGYYKVRILDKYGQRFDILRNHRYEIVIKEVSGAGYPTRDEALEGNIYLHADVVEWDNVGQNVIFDGDHYLEVSHPTIQLYKEAGYLYIDLETDFPGVGTMRSGISIDSNTIPVWVDLKEVDPTSNSVIAWNNGAMKRRLKLTWQEMNGYGVVGEPWSIDVPVVAGNMTMVMHISQTDKSWIDVPSVVAAPCDGKVHEFNVVSDMDWVATHFAVNHIETLTSSSEDAGKPYKGEYTYYYRPIELPYDPTQQPGELLVNFKNDEYHYSTYVNIVTAHNLHDGESNCYILAPGENIIFPVNRNPGYIRKEDSVYGDIVWMDKAKSAGLIESVRTLGKGPEAYLHITAGSVEGNAVVAAMTDKWSVDVDVPANEDYVTRWSWHMWITDYDPEATAETFESLSGFTVTTMDRMLGALAGDPGNPATVDGFNAMKGLFYQWGRKDPFPADNTLMYDNLGTATIDPGNVMNSANVKQGTIMYPTRPARSVGSWIGTDGLDSWGASIGVKQTDYDPCPEGWKVPYHNYWGRNDTGPTASPAGMINIKATYPEIVPGSLSSTQGWLYWPGYGGYFIEGGLRSTTSSFETVSNTTYGYTWSGQRGEPNNQRHGFSYSLANSNYNNSGVSAPSTGKNIRCVKEQ